MAEGGGFEGEDDRGEKAGDGPERAGAPSPEKPSGAEGKEQDGQTAEEDDPVAVGGLLSDGPVGGGGPFVLKEPAGVGGGGAGREKALGTPPVTIFRRGARSGTR